MPTLHRGLFGSDPVGFDTTEPSPNTSSNLGGLWLNDIWPNLSLFDAGKHARPSSDEAVAVGDLGTIAALSSGGTGTASTGGSAGSAPAPTEVTTAGSGLTIDLDWDASVSSAPAGFMSDMIAAAQFLEGQLSNPVTINLQVGYGEIDGTSLGSDAIGESETNIVSVSYSSLVAALRATASTDTTDANVLASLPSTSPVSGTYWVTTAQAKALGLSSANGTDLDGAIGFAPSTDVTYGDTNGSGTVAANTYDFYSTAVHEITETMGRQLLVGESIGGTVAYSLLDLMHYSAPAVHDFTQSTPGYFSANGGTTSLGNFNTIAGGDPGDWASSVPDDSFDAYGTPGVSEAVTTNDLTEMDAIGWNLSNPSAQAPALTVFDTTTNQPAAAVAQPYTGPVSGVQQEYVSITADNLNITATTPNWFIYGGNGEDAIAVSSGTNVLDGGAGSDFLTGGTGDDTFYLDDRTPTSPIFSTVTNFHSGDNVTVWGVNPTDFTMLLLDNQGAAGFTGLDFVFTAPGHITTSLVLAGYTSADLAAGTLTSSYGTTANVGDTPGSQYFTIHGT